METLTEMFVLFFAVAVLAFVLYGAAILWIIYEPELHQESIDSAPKYGFWVSPVGKFWSRHKRRGEEPQNSPRCWKDVNRLRRRR